MQQNHQVVLCSMNSFRGRVPMAKPEELRRRASHLLLVAKRTKDPVVSESCSMQASELLDQAQDLEAAPSAAHRDDDKSRN